MAGKPTAGLLESVKIMLTGVPAYTAAHQAGIHHTTLYRHWIYKQWKSGQLDSEQVATILGNGGVKPK